MDWKKKIPEIRERLVKLWTKIQAGCAVAWDRTKVYAKRTWTWLKKYGAIVWEYARKLLGKLAVAALKFRKWVLKMTARLRDWWSRWEGRKWLRARADQCAQLVARIREKLPKPAAPDPVPEAAPEEVPEAASEVIQEEVPEEPAAVPEVQPAEEAPAPKVPMEKKEYGKFVAILVAIGRVIKITCLWIFKLRKFIMAAPVVYYALKLAILNSNRLPEMVGLQIQASGEFARMVSRESAVMMPLALTGFCLLLLFCSKKTLLPWLISIFTLIMPLLIWMTNFYA